MNLAVRPIKKQDDLSKLAFLECSFSSKEIDVLACLLRGKSSKKIAAVLGIQAKTVDNHVGQITGKLGVHSRADVIHLLEKHGDLEGLHLHYAQLLRARHFKEALQKTAGYLRGKHIACKALCTDKVLLQKMSLNLKKAGIRLSDDVHVKTIRILLMADEEETITEKGIEDVSGPLTISVFYTGNDEALFFEIVDHLYPTAFVKEAHNYFESDVTTAYHRADPATFSRTLSWLAGLRKRREPLLYVILSFFLLCLCGLLYTTIINKKGMLDPTSTHLVLAIPDDAHRLDRKHLMAKLAACFKKNNSIQTAILVGIGGSGKTTLARQYARYQNCPIVWEINAETKNDLIESFEHLAYATSKTADEQVELARIKSMANESEKKKFLLFFVQRNFRNIKKPWCVIFDNVEKFSDIQEFFPQNTTTWGRGQVLITTQNEHIVNNPQIGSRAIIHVDALSDQERFSFFAKLVFGSENPALNANAKREATQFLKKIPSYPLDISLAAHDITVNRLTYQQCIERQKSTNLEFEKIPDQFFGADVSDYKKTRYSTIVTNMKSLIQTYPGFQELFLMIALIGSQHIPKDLLLACQNQQTVDQFIDHMKKLSFMTHDQAGYQRGDHVSNTLSIHRSTQDVMLTYFERFLDKQDRDKSALCVIEALERYTNPFIAAVSISKARAVLNHLLIVLKHQAVLPSLARGILNLQLGRLYYCLYDLKNASLFSESSLQDLQAHYQKTVHIRLARALACFGIANKMITNDYEKGMRCLEKSLELYTQHFPDNYEELAWVLLQLGNTYVIIDDNKKAAEVLVKGMAIYDQHYAADYPKVAWGLLYQGDVARLSGDYAGAEQFYKKSRNLFEKKYGKNYSKTMWAEIRLAVTYMLSGKWIEAKDLLEALPLTYEKQVTENHDNVIWQTFCLGEVYRYLGCYQEAKVLLNQSFKICCDSYSEVCTAWWPTIHLGKIYMDLGDYAMAETLLMKSFTTQQKHIGIKHIRTSWAAHQLANVYTKTGKFSEAGKLFAHVLEHYQKHYGANHLECAHLLCDLGEFYLLQRDYSRGKASLDQAMDIFMQSKHPALYRCFEVLGDFYLAMLPPRFCAAGQTQEDRETQKTNLSLSLYNFRTALDMTQSRFPKNSAHTARIQQKIQKILSMKQEKS